MKKIGLLACLFFSVFNSFSQDAEKAKQLLDAVSEKMTSYDNMTIGFTTSLMNEEVGIKEGDEPPLIGNIILQKDKYHLNYLDNVFIFNGNKLYVINHEEKEINTSDADLTEEDGFIYPSKLVTFYKEGYRFSLGETKTEGNKKIQYVQLIPIDSNSEIVKVIVGINTQSKHIYTLAQIGANGSKTTFTIEDFKSNQSISSDLFTVDIEKYKKENYTID